MYMYSNISYCSRTNKLLKIHHTTNEKKTSKKMCCQYILRLYSLSERIDIQAPNYTTDLPSGNILSNYITCIHYVTARFNGLKQFFSVTDRHRCVTVTTTTT